MIVIGPPYTWSPWLGQLSIYRVISDPNECLKYSRLRKILRQLRRRALPGDPALVCNGYIMQGS
jgi:hypothetical protein